jgi:hypothetical protein
MRLRPWVSLRLVTAFAVAMSAVVIGIASAQSASALTACGALRATAGPWFAMKNNSNRNLSWNQGSGQFAGALVSLKSYTGTENECWKILGGFGGSRLEISDTHQLCLTANQVDPRTSGVPMQMEPCLSHTNQMFILRRLDQYELASDSALCIGLSLPVGAGAVIYQHNCSNSSPGQAWFVDGNP